MKNEFIELCLAAEALRFGSFQLKSGRVSPYFFNAGRFCRGELLGRVAQHYARVLVERVGRDFMLFGPAYKGIALAAATAMQLAEHHNLDVGYAFNRKEAKDHGEGGATVGATLRGNVVIIDDVITAGTSIGESVAVIREAGATPHAVVIALDREETAGEDGLSAVQKVQAEYGIAVHAIIGMGDLMEYLAGQAGAESDERLVAMREYQTRF